jgi:hypothetical protein
MNTFPVEGIALDIQIAALDVTNPTNRAAWFNKALLVQGNTASTETLDLGTATTLGNQTLTVSATADTTNACINLTVTPPAGTGSDQWDFTATVNSTEAAQ